MASSSVEFEIEDILQDSLEFIGASPVPKDEIIRYGPLTLRVAPKDGKATTLMADQLFSPAFLLAERIERGLMRLSGRFVIEIGAGCALPSMISACIENHPVVLAITDHPAPVIFNSLTRNVEENREAFLSDCEVLSASYAWGEDPTFLRSLLPSVALGGFSDIILSDLLHFDTPEILVKSICDLVLKAANARIHVAAGKYTHDSVCLRFIEVARHNGIAFEEVVPSAPQEEWLGTFPVQPYTREDLASRKYGSRYWLGRFVDL
ncbi:hypothetical protein DL96DRAFT_1696141 [Flagelloscypha sp. PMI_526]|nr:hypothetical protein DL96DRAFT_1696141 [Flagelloscypha sp. PMI_526]